MLQWIAATLAVLALVMLLGRAGRWALGQSRGGGGAVNQIGAWRVSPDAQVRAIRVLDRAYLLYERGRTTTLLEDLEADDLQARLSAAGATGGPSAILRLRPRGRRVAGR